MTDKTDFEKEQIYARHAKKYYDSAVLQLVTRLTWWEIVALEARGAFPKRATEIQGDVWRRSDVDAWLKDRKP